MDRYISLSDYIEVLLTDTLDGVIASEAANLEKIYEVKASVDLNDDEFFKLYINEVDIRNEILYLFPTDVAYVSSIDPGQPYVPQSENSEEKPNIFRKLNYKMTSEDYVWTYSGYVITEKGYENLYNAEKIIYTNLKRSVIKQLIFKGIPNILVDKGQISSPLNLSGINIKNFNSLYEHGLRYKLYKEVKLNYNSPITISPFKEGICTEFTNMQEEFLGANTIIFEGYIEIETSDRYTFYLNSESKCIIKIDDKKVLYNYYEEKTISNLNLYEGYHKFYMICDRIALEKGIEFSYKTIEMEEKEAVGESMIYYMKETAYKEPYIYKGIEGDLQVILKPTESKNSDVSGQIILYYTISRS